MEIGVEGFDVNQMTKWKPAIWGPPEAATYRKGFVVDILEIICCREFGKQRTILSIIYHG